LTVTGDIDRELAIAFRPVVRGFLLAMSLYYTLLSLSYIVFPPHHYPFWEHSTMLGLIGSSAVSGWIMYRASRHTCRKLSIELYTIAASAIVLTNIAVHMSFRFQPENLIYFILAMPTFAASCISMRTMIPIVAITLATMMGFIATYAPDMLVQYLFLAVAAGIAATGMANLMRGTVFRAVQARMESDQHRAKAESLAAKAEELTRQTRELAERDHLTGLANRFSFFNSFGTALARRRSTDSESVLALIDLDGFKPVNDAYGHSVGDQLLGEVGRRLTAIAPRQSILARLGGDEFAILVRRNRLTTSVESFGQSLCKNLSEPYAINAIRANITASIGLVVCDRPDLSIRQLMERGDFALTSAKQTTRGEAVVFGSHHETDMLSAGRIDQALRACPLESELRVVFQPQYDLELGRTYGFEALGRWNSSVLGPVSPDSFIKAAEASGLIRKITQILLRKTLDAFKAWPGELSVSFNLSGHDLMSPVAVDEILDLVKRSGIEPARIEFEITETVMMTDIDQARRSIERISALGCKLALDDFGSGHSSFSYLHQLPVSKIKIDRSFVTPLLKDASASKIVRTIINLGHSLDLDCVVEGVETQAELNLLKDMQARYIQGYIFGKPMEADLVAPYLDAEARGVEKFDPVRPASSTIAKFPARRR
tara:strand:- start:117589 stop:119562 length:1974 start_codon:yes stop_codon:yes gene_type:complete